MLPRHTATNKLEHSIDKMCITYSHHKISSSDGTKLCHFCVVGENHAKSERMQLQFPQLDSIADARRPFASAMSGRKSSPIRPVNAYDCRNAKVNSQYDLRGVFLNRYSYFCSFDSTLHIWQKPDSFLASVRESVVQVRTFVGDNSHLDECVTIGHGVVCRTHTNILNVHRVKTVDIFVGGKIHFRKL